MSDCVKLFYYDISFKSHLELNCFSYLGFEVYGKYTTKRYFRLEFLKLSLIMLQHKQYFNLQNSNAPQTFYGKFVICSTQSRMQFWIFAYILYSAPNLLH